MFRLILQITIISITFATLVTSGISEAFWTLVAMGCICAVGSLLVDGTTNLVQAAGKPREATHEWYLTQQNIHQHPDPTRPDMSEYNIIEGGRRGNRRG